MRREQNSACLAVLLSLLADSGLAQCFPDSSASWCFISAANSEAVNTHMVMGADPDTVILGQTYKRVEEFNNAIGLEPWQYVKRYYVRSDSAGKGYVMLLDSMQEYLTADVSAMAGDTVHNVLTAEFWGFDQTYWLTPVVVDSVRILVNNEVTVTRQYVHAIGFEPLSAASGYGVFWQAGIGGSYGPILIQTIADGFHAVECLREQDTCVYSSPLPGLPGIPCDCPLESPLGVGDLPSVGHVLVSPNPSAGIFTLNARIRSSTVYDATGKRLFEAGGASVDLSAHPPGLYTAVVTSSVGWQTVRLVVER